MLLFVLLHACAALRGAAGRRWRSGSGGPAAAAARAPAPLFIFWLHLSPLLHVWIYLHQQIVIILTAAPAAHGASTNARSTGRTPWRGTHRCGFRPMKAETWENQRQFSIVWQAAPLGSYGRPTSAASQRCTEQTRARPESGSMFPLPTLAPTDHIHHGRSSSPRLGLAFGTGSGDSLPSAACGPPGSEAGPGGRRDGCNVSGKSRRGPARPLFAKRR